MAGNEWEVRYQEYSKRMAEKLPKMYGEDQHYGGFCIGEGWWTLVEKLSTRIQEHIDWVNGQRERLLVDNPHSLKIPDEVPQVHINQVKEKFGGLRFYYDGGDKFIDGMVDFAETMSYTMCEECGNPGKPRRTGWIRTLCDHHEQIHQEKRNAKVDSDS